MELIITNKSPKTGRKREELVKKMTFRVALVLGLVSAAVIVGLCFYQHRKLAAKEDQKVESSDRAFPPAPMIDETEAPLPLQIDDAVAKKLNSLGYSTNVAPIKVVGGEDSNK